MDRALVISYLHAAEIDVAIIEQEITNQCSLISSLRGGAHDASRASAELLVMEQTHMQYIGDRDRLRAALAALNSEPAKDDASIVSGPPGPTWPQAVDASDALCASVSAARANRSDSGVESPARAQN